MIAQQVARLLPHILPLFADIQALIICDAGGGSDVGCGRAPVAERLDEKPKKPSSNQLQSRISVAQTLCLA